MTIQEEIREGIRRELTFNVEDTEYWEIGNHFALKGKAITKLLNYLKSQGAVLKVKRALPENPYTNAIPYEEPSEENLAYKQAQNDMADRTAYEEII